MSKCLVILRLNLLNHQASGKDQETLSKSLRDAAL